MNDVGYFAALGDSLRDAAVWLEHHSVQIDLTVVWGMAIVCWYVAYVKIRTWYRLKPTRDLSTIGLTLKPQKLTEAVFFSVMGAYWVMNLVGYYFSIHYTFWTGFPIRVAMVVAAVLVAWFSRQFDNAMGSWRPITRVDRLGRVSHTFRRKGIHDES